MPVLQGFASQGLSRRAMVTQLNDLGIKAPRGGASSLGQVQRLCAALTVAVQPDEQQHLQCALEVYSGSQAGV